jgi:hypothetical protein
MRLIDVPAHQRSLLFEVFPAATRKGSLLTMLVWLGFMILVLLK